jgi:hypothetical protein
MNHEIDKPYERKESIRYQFAMASLLLGFGVTLLACAMIVRGLVW